MFDIKISKHYYMFFFLMVISFGQVVDSETGELVNLKYDKKTVIEEKVRSIEKQEEVSDID